jgi:acyl-CoA reductase-like NAD-dependent aldehyde dehydrogenase
MAPLTGVAGLGEPVFQGVPNPSLADAKFEGISEVVSFAQAFQRIWGMHPIDERLRILRRIRVVLAERAGDLAVEASGPQHSVYEALAAEVLPLLEACSFLERDAKAILATRHLGSDGRPVWIGKVQTEISREPLGVVGVISPSNYPLFLGAVQVLQALVAGNAVLWKPAHGYGKVAQSFAAIVVECGFPPGILHVLPDSDEAGRELTEQRLDKVFFTGSYEVGTKVTAALGQHAVPAVAELSGCDAMFVREDAEMERVGAALRFGLSFNGSRTCIAPRRVFVARKIAAEFEQVLSESIASIPSFPISQRDRERVAAMLARARGAGLRFLHGADGGDIHHPVAPIAVFVDAQTASIFEGDFFFPIISVRCVEDDVEAIRADGMCSYALGSTIFSRNQSAARHLASNIRAGSIVINDLIVPTADPRIPFGGSRRSGYGVTRGAEGLLEMTRAKVLQVRLGGIPAHLSGHVPSAGLLLALIRMLHGGTLLSRARAVLNVAKLGFRQWREMSLQKKLSKLKNGTAKK